jgi:hypothetical protein
MTAPMVSFPEPAQINGNSGPPDSTEIALAEPICRTAHRDAPPGMPGSCADPWRMAFASGPEIVLSLLQRDANASGIGQGHSPPPPSAASRYHCQRSNTVGTTPPLCSDMIFGRHIGPNPYRALCRGHWLCGHTGRKRLTWPVRAWMPGLVRSGHPRPASCLPFDQPPEYPPMIGRISPVM